jgi:hypothetical protein
MTDDDDNFPPQGVHKSAEISPQAKKMLSYQFKLKVQQVCTSEDGEEPDPSLHSPHGPIWIPKQVYCNRYEETD